MSNPPLRITWGKDGDPAARSTAIARCRELVTATALGDPDDRQVELATLARISAEVVGDALAVVLLLQELALTARTLLCATGAALVAEGRPWDPSTALQCVYQQIDESRCPSSNPRSPPESG